jgi:hypothetical protein
MSPTFGGAPPSRGASDLRVDPQALWDVGLALQRVRDAICAFHSVIWSERVGATPTSVPDGIPEVWESWRQFSMATAGPPTGLTKQLESMAGVLDSQMMSLRQAIEAYVIAEAESRLRLARLDD